MSKSFKCKDFRRVISEMLNRIAFIVLLGIEESLVDSSIARYSSFLRLSEQKASPNIAKVDS